MTVFGERETDGSLFKSALWLNKAIQGPVFSSYMPWICCLFLFYFYFICKSCFLFRNWIYRGSLQMNLVGTHDTAAQNCMPCFQKACTKARLKRTQQKTIFFSQSALNFDGKYYPCDLNWCSPRENNSLLLFTRMHVLPHTWLLLMPSTFCHQMLTATDVNSAHHLRWKGHQWGNLITKMLYSPHNQFISSRLMFSQ